MSSIISALQIIFLLGLVLAVVGQIGRRVFASNSCWRCRFDLSGHPGVPDGPFPVVCPECGESIAEPGMLRVDKQVPRAGLRRLGLILMLAIVPVAVVFVRAGYSLDPYRVATNRAIIRVAELGDFRGLEEFQRRFDGNLFRQADLQEIGRKAAEIIRAMPQDRVEPGLPTPMGLTTGMWGDAYLKLLAEGLVSKTDAMRLLEQIVTVQISFPPHNRVDDTFFIHVNLYAHAVDSTRILHPGYTTELADLHFAGKNLASLSVSKSGVQLSPDDLFLGHQTFGVSWTFSIAEDQFVLADEHVGPSRVETKVILQSCDTGDSNFISDLLRIAADGRMEYEVAREIVVQPRGDMERARFAPSIAQIFQNHVRFDLRLRPPYMDLLELTVILDDQFDLLNDTVIAGRLVASDTDGQRLDDELLVIESDARSRTQRLVRLLIKHKELVMRDGGVWIEMTAVPPYPRNQAWRPLVITGELEPVWVPLESPTP